MAKKESLGVTFSEINGQEKALFDLLTLSQRQRIFLHVAKKATLGLKTEAKKNRELSRLHKSSTRKALIRSFGVTKTKGLGVRAGSSQFRGIGVRAGFRRKGKHIGELAHLIDSGTNPRVYRTKSGKFKYTGKMKGTHFWTKAKEKEMPKVAPEFKRHTDEGLKKWVSSYNNKWKNKKV